MACGTLVHRRREANFLGWISANILRVMVGKPGGFLGESHLDEFYCRPFVPYAQRQKLNAFVKMYSSTPTGKIISDTYVEGAVEALHPQESESQGYRQPKSRMKDYGILKMKLRPPPIFAFNLVHLDLQARTIISLLPLRF